MAFHEKLRDGVKATALASTSGLVESLREIKDAGEIAEILEAIRIAEQAFETIRRKIQPGRTEKEVADELEYQIRLCGGTCGAFPSMSA